MARSKSKDLFDDTTMSFGEHLEVLRVHMFRAILWLVVGVGVALFFGKDIVAVIRSPIDAALKDRGITGKYGDDVETEDGQQFPRPPDFDPQNPFAIPVTIEMDALQMVLHRADPKRYPAPADLPREEADVAAAPEGGAANTANGHERTVTFTLSSNYFAQLRAAVDKLEEPITLRVEEAFMTYLKVSLVAGMVLAAPFMFREIWLFVAAGLYPHERRYAYIYGPMSLGLFLGGTLFCFFAVFPYVLDFLLGFNEWLGVTPQIRLSEWISFAVMLPVMFGLSFQLPLVMLFLERISVFDAKAYREKRRMAILVIAVISMFLTPADPMSMTMMMIPLIGLYELGIQLCRMGQGAESPFPAEPA